MAKPRKISVIGLGYVGLTTAVALSTLGKLIGFDINKQRIEELQQGLGSNGEVTTKQLKTANIHYTSNSKDLSHADFYIITVPTPVNIERQPDLSMLLSATKMLSKQLKTGDIVVYESTVYPGATEEKCIPLLELESGLICNKDFSECYWPKTNRTLWHGSASICTTSL